MTVSRFVPMLDRLLLTLWVGGIWVAGYVVAPIVFAVLPERAVAGTVAGEVFRVMSYVGLACGLGLLALWAAGGVGWRGWRSGLVLAMLLATALGEWGFAPEIRALREAMAQGAGPEVVARFRWVHGAASLVFLAVSLGGLVLVLAGPLSPAAATSTSSRGGTTPPPGQ